MGNIKKILITGGTGLIASQLTEELSPETGYRIFVCGRNKNEARAKQNVEYIALDLSKEWDENLLPKDLYAIIHLAQSENFRDFPNSAKEVFSVNTFSTVKLIDHAIKNKISHFIYASSGAVYSKAAHPLKEDNNIAYDRRLGFYAATKHCSETILLNYFDLLNVSIIRFFFVYGKGQRKEMLIPRLVNSIKEDAAINLEGESGIRINPIHARDAALAIKNILNMPGSRILNIGGSEVLSLKEIAENIGALLNKAPRFTYSDRSGYVDMIGDIDEMKSTVHVPQINFNEGIKELL